MASPQIVLVAMVSVMLLSAPYAAAITCGEVSGYLKPCFSYLQRGGLPSASCCAGVTNLNSAATTTTDRRVACNCVKSSRNRSQPLTLERSDR
ncbi:hypothetical protein CFC21_100871 [Triticum aestivum]|nr:hypothetical protein CFC21_100871 [Triticum aestivum]